MLPRSASCARHGTPPTTPLSATLFAHVARRRATSVGVLLVALTTPRDACSRDATTTSNSIAMPVRGSAPLLTRTPHLRAPYPDATSRDQPHMCARMTPHAAMRAAACARSLERRSTESSWTARRAGWGDGVRGHPHTCGGHSPECTHFGMRRWECSGAARSQLHVTTSRARSQPQCSNDASRPSCDVHVHVASSMSVSAYARV